jgi:pimeloyl-ACP methyl ester carboxylesterase
MRIGSVVRDILCRRRRDLVKNLARWIGLLLGSLLLIGMAASEEDNSFVRSTLLTANGPAENVLVVPSIVSPPVLAQPSDAPQTDEFEPTQAESLPRSGIVLPDSSASVDSLSSTIPVAPTIAPVERETHQPRPAPAKTSAAPVQTWPLPGYDLFLHLPPDAPQSGPFQVILALHGIGAQGEAFARVLVADADRNGWLVVAPSLPYGDYMNPNVLAEEDVRLSQMLATTLDDLPQRLGLKLLPKVLVFGFSRGAQLGHRFAMFYPDRVQAVAILSAGTYTLPEKEGITESGVQPLPLPYGVADVEGRLNRPLNLDLFEKIPFLIEVGAKDDRAADVPRQFDFLDGTTRLARAKSFDRALESLGMKCQLVIAPNADHEVNTEMLASAIKFLKENAPKSTAQP